MTEQSATRGLRIALGHKSRVGKDTFAERIVSTHPNTITLSFAALLYEVVNAVQAKLGREVVKDGPLLQKQATLLREHYGINVFVDPVAACIENIERDNPGTNIIITDMRLHNEWDMLVGKGFVTVRIDRANRPIDRDPNHETEISLDGAQYDRVIENNGTPSEYLSKVDQLVSSLM